MLAKTRRKLNMAARVLQFSEEHPSQSPGFVAAVTRLQESVARAEQLARQQLAGQNEVRVATARKAELRRQIRSTYLDHILTVAQSASVEERELAQRFTYPHDATTYQAFFTAATSILAEAESRKDLLMKHGLAEEVLSGFRVALDQFQTVVEQGDAGRLAHVGASADLRTVSEQAAQVVKVMNGLVRILYANQSEPLAKWESASNVIGPPHPQDDDPTAPGELKPAA
jgi:uncharacterized protein (UPF0210 family)